MSDPGSAESTGPGVAKAGGENVGPNTVGKRFGETLLAPSLVRLFGRVFTGLKIVQDEAENATDQPYPSNQAAQLLNNKNAVLARIYGFSFEGNYYKMAAPAIFVVNGPGQAVPAGYQDISLSILGVEFKDEVFAGEVRMWGYDKLDQAIRIDVTTGWLQEIL